MSLFRSSQKSYQDLFLIFIFRAICPKAFPTH
jgi:hypothetical protein